MVLVYKEMYTQQLLSSADCEPVRAVYSCTAVCYEIVQFREDITYPVSYTYNIQLVIIKISLHWS